MPFAPVHFTTGPVVPSWNANQLGYCEDGVQIQIFPRWADIFSDDMGGREGVPTDSQFLGATASIRLLLTKYNKTLCDSLSCFTQAALTSGAKGLMPVLGSFARQDSLAATLLLTGVNENISFATAMLRGNYEINSGTKYRRYVVDFEALLNQTDYTAITSAQTRRLYTLTP
jgi:hypothetical protein